MGSRALGLDLGLGPGLSIKNAMLYATFSAIAIESVVSRNRKVELLPVILPYALLMLYAFMTWLVLVLFVANPYYDALSTLIRLKVKLVDQFLILLVFFYGVVNVKDALWLLKALVWVVVLGCFITVVDSFNIPDLGIVTSRWSDGRVEGILGSSQEFGALCAFFLPAIVALWWPAAGFRKVLALVGIGLVLVSLMLSASRGAMLGIVAGGIMAAFFLRQFVSAPIVARAVLAMMAFSIVATLVVFSTDFGDLLRERLSTGMTTGDLETISSGRTAIWGAALQEMAQYPISFVTGLGWEAYYQTIGYRFSTHSVYLDRLYNLGFIGLALYLLSYSSAIVIARRGLRSASEQTTPLLIATVVGMTSFMISMAFSNTEGATPYIWAFTGLALRVAVTNIVKASENPAVTLSFARAT